MTRMRIGWTRAGLAVATLAAAGAYAADRPEWGGHGTRNMVSDETGLPTEFGTNLNVRWSVRLGSETYATPVIADGRVYIGTNNEPPNDPHRDGDRGVMLCLDEKTGALLWQLPTAKLAGDIYLDWPRSGLCSPPTVSRRRVFAVSNRSEVMALDPEGMKNGNDGPFFDEAALFALPGREPAGPFPLDADAIWVTDLPKAVGMYNHDSAHASVLADGPFLYVNTCNGVDNTHRKIRRPDAPNLVVLDRETGRVLARDRENIGPRITHCQWSSPAIGEAGGRRFVVLGGADAVVYAFEPLTAAPGEGEPSTLKKVWSFDCDPGAIKLNACEWNGKRNTTNGPATIEGMPVFVGGRVYVAGGGDPWWGKREAWLKCIDASGAGDVTRTAQMWSYPLQRHCFSTPSVSGGLVFIGDWGRTLHCVDAATGQACWTHDLEGEIWGSTLVADGKVYAATRKGAVWVFAASREKKLLHCAPLDSGIPTSPVAANGTLYVATMNRLWAFGTAGGK